MIDVTTESITVRKKRAEIRDDVSETPVLSVIIVNWNGEEYLDECLDSIYRHTRDTVIEVILVDNASKDNSLSLVRSSYPQVRIIENDANLGFAKANNVAFEHCRGKYILLMNPDTRILGDALSEMVEFMSEHPEAGISGCKVLNPDLSLQPACRRTIPTPWIAFYRLVGLSRIFPTSKRFGRYNLGFMDPDSEMEVDAVSGSFLMLRREILKDVGYLDERFFLYGEELDWCLRVQRKGWKVLYNPKAEIIHYKGGLSKRNRIRSLYEFHRAMVLFHQKHFAGALIQPLNWLIFSGVFVRGIIAGFIPTAKRIAAMALDGLLINAGQVAAFYLKLGGTIQPHFNAYLKAAPLMTVVTIATMAMARLYSNVRERDTIQIVYETLRAVTFSMGIVVIATFVHRGFSTILFPYPRSVFVLGWILSAIILSVSKTYILSKYVPRHAANRIAIIGTNEPARRLSEEFKVRLSTGSTFMGFIADEPEIPSGSRLLGTVDDLSDVLHRYALTEVIIAIGSWAPHRLMNVIAICENMGTNVKILPNLYEILIGRVELTNIAGMPLIKLPLDPLSNWYRAIKRSGDIFGSFTGIILSSWLVPFIALGIRLSGPGPVLFRQIRVGKNRKSFILYKFRTMHPDAELESGPVLAKPKDPRVTKFGRMLRFSHLDELPQLINILKGEMSFVGPRPERPEFVNLFVKEDSTYERRFVVRPGLTGLAQINGRYDSVPADKLKFDLAYINNINLGLDFRIIMASIRLSIQHLFRRNT